MEKNEIISLKQAVHSIEDIREMQFLWGGIPNSPSITLIAAPPKVGIHLT